MTEVILSEIPLVVEREYRGIRFTVYDSIESIDS